MSVIGPRPQLVRDMTFMTKEQRMRHTAKPGLSGLAQVNGRNAITWEDKLEWDQKYIKKVGFKEDVRIILETVKKAFIKQEGISQDNMATAEDFGDYLLKNKKITSEEYDKKQIEATLVYFIGFFGIFLGTVIASLVSLIMMFIKFHTYFGFTESLKSIIGSLLKNNCIVIVTIVIVFILKKTFVIESLILQILIFGAATLIIYLLLSMLLYKNFKEMLKMD